MESQAAGDPFTQILIIISRLYTKRTKRKRRRNVAISVFNVLHVFSLPIAFSPSAVEKTSRVLKGNLFFMMCMQEFSYTSSYVPYTHTTKKKVPIWDALLSLLFQTH